MLSSSLIVLLAASSFVNGLPSLFRREVHDVASVPGLDALANIPRADAVVAPLGNVAGRQIKRDFTTLKGGPLVVTTDIPVALGTQTPKGPPNIPVATTTAALEPQTAKGEQDGFGNATATASPVTTTLTFVPLPTNPVPNAVPVTPDSINTPSTFVDAPAQDPGFSG